MKYLLILFFTPYATALLAEGPEKNCRHDKNTFRCVSYIKNYDGDTITFKIPNVHPLFGNNIAIRVSGVDTPELRTKNKCEKKLGYQAKEVVENALRNAKHIELRNVKRGKYFRIVADVIADGKNVSDLLLQRKFAYRYDGGTKQKIDWCKNSNLRKPASD